MRISTIIADIIQIINRKHSDLQNLSDDDHEQYLLVAGTRAMTGNLLIGANGIQSTNLLIKEVSADSWEVRNVADDAYKNIVAASFILYGNMAFLENNKELRAPNVDDYSLIFTGRENTVGLLEVARIRGAATPAFEILRGKLTGDLDANSKEITSLKAPTADSSAARKDSHHAAFNSYSDVTGSRAIDTIYQNTSGKTMIVLVSVVLRGSGATGRRATLIAKVGSGTPPADEQGRVELLQTAYAEDVYETKAQMTMVVPNDYYYQALESVATGGSTVLGSWIEITS